MRTRMALFGMALAAGLATAPIAVAAPLGFATDTSGDLYRVDFGGGGSATLIGSTGQFFESIALAPSGTLYGATSGGVLYSISTTTGAVTLIGNTGLGNIEGLDFNGNTLLATDFANTPSVYSLNLASAAPTLVATANIATDVVRSMAVLNATTILIRSDLNNDTLFSLDLTTGAVTMLGAQSATIYGMDFLDGGLYGLSEAGEMYSINAANGALTLIGDTGDHFWLSLTGATGGLRVPLPGTLWLLVLGVATLVARRRCLVH